MPAGFETVFQSLRSILVRQTGALRIKSDSPDCFCLEAEVGPATVKAWGGKIKSPSIPVAWVETGKSYVSFHLMGLYGNEKLRGSLSKELLARMQGKTCFNFKQVDAALFRELEQ